MPAASVVREIRLGDRKLNWRAKKFVVSSRLGRNLLLRNPAGHDEMPVYDTQLIGCTNFLLQVLATLSIIELYSRSTSFAVVDSSSRYTFGGTEQHIKVVSTAPPRRRTKR